MEMEEPRWWDRTQGTVGSGSQVKRVRALRWWENSVVLKTGEKVKYLEDRELAFGLNSGGFW